MIRTFFYTILLTIIFVSNSLSEIVTSFKIQGNVR